MLQARNIQSDETQAATKRSMMKEEMVKISLQKKEEILIKIFQKERLCKKLEKQKRGDIAKRTQVQNEKLMKTQMENQRQERIRAYERQKVMKRLDQEKSNLENYKIQKEKLLKEKFTLEQINQMKKDLFTQVHLEMKWYNNYDVRKIDKIMNSLISKVAAKGTNGPLNPEKLFQDCMKVFHEAQFKRKSQSKLKTVQAMSLKSISAKKSREKRLSSQNSRKDDLKSEE